MTKKDLVCDCNIIHESVVKDTLNKMPKSTLFNQLAEFFKLLGDRTRAKILFALDQNELCVCDLANVLNMTKSSVSHQLSALKKMGIVKSRKDGKEVYYTLDDDHVKGLFELGIEHIEHRNNENK